MLYCLVIISREIENVMMIIKLNCNLPTGATELFLSTFHPNSLNHLLLAGALAALCRELPPCRDQRTELSTCVCSPALRSVDARRP